MRDDKDRSGKWLIERHGGSLLHLSGVRGFVSWRAAANEVVLPKQVPDGLLEVHFPGQASADLFLLEIETYADREHEKQIMDDVSVVLGARGALPEVISIILRPRGTFRLGGEKRMSSRLGHSRMTFNWRIIEMWTLNAEDLLAASDVGLIPWVPLTHYDGPPKMLIQQCRERIDRQALPNEHESLLALTRVLTTFVYNDEELARILLGGQDMVQLDSPLLRIIMARETRQEGILDNLEARFTTVPPEISVAVKAIKDEQRLKELHRCAAVCPDLEAFRKKLGL